MFNIALALVLSWDDDRQTVFLAKPVRSAADIVITPLVGMIVLCLSRNLTVSKHWCKVCSRLQDWILADSAPAQTMVEVHIVRLLADVSIAVVSLYASTVPA